MVILNTPHSIGSNTTEGVYRLQKTIRVTLNGLQRIDAILVGHRGSFRCEDWNSAFTGAPHANRLFKCILQLDRKQSGRQFIRLIQTEPIRHFTWNELRKIAVAHFPLPETLQLLSEIIRQVPQIPLKNFIQGIFQTPEIVLPFFRFPASRDYHHDYAGGLATHSLETAQIACSALLDPNKEETSLVIVAGLFHDIGKIHTLNERGNRTTMGRVMRHEQLTLEILAEPFKQLSGEWPDGAIALRYLLTCSPEQIKRPLLPCALAINFADRMSASMSARLKTSKCSQNKPFICTQSKGPKSWFWLPEKAPLNIE